MKTLKIMASKLETKLTCDYLAAHGITTVVNGSRDYASIVTGNDLGRYEIMVNEEQEKKAKQLIHEISAKEVEEKTPLSEWSLIKRSVMFVFMSGLILPIIFNLASIYFLTKYYQSATPGFKRLILTALIAAANIGAVAVFALLYL